MTRTDKEALRDATIQHYGIRYCTHGQHVAPVDGGAWRRKQGSARWICADCLRRMK